MANVLPFDLRVKIVASLVEGTSIRATARQHSVDKDAVMRLGVVVGLACLTLHARLVTGVRMAMGEVDEVWAFVGRHARRKLANDPVWFGDHYTMFCIDPVTKLVPAFLTGGARPCDRVKFQETRRALGMPNLREASTSIAERLNLTTRMHQRRLTRLTNAYSKKPENLRAAVGLHFAWYNWVRVHETIGTTPAVAAGLADAPWSLADLVRAALAIAEETPEPTSPEPAPEPTPDPTMPEPLPMWDGWREPAQLALPGVEPANDNAIPAAVQEEDDDAPATVRDPIPWGDSAAE